MRDRVNFTTEYYFPARAIWGIVAGIAAVSFFATHYLLVSALSGLAGVIFLTTRYGVEISFRDKRYQEYTWVLGLRLGERAHFDSIRYLFIKDFKVAQTVNSRVNSSTFTSDEFRGFVKFSNEEKIHLITRPDHEAVIKELKNLAAELNVSLVDYSYGQQQKLV